MSITHTGPSGSTTGQAGSESSTQGARGATPQPVPQTNQPLSDLYTNRYVPTNLKYPSNLDDSTRGHIIQFSINDTIPASYVEGNLTPTVDGQTGGVAASTKKSLFFQPQRTRIPGTIALYIPDNISESYAASYTDVSVLDAIKEGASALSGVTGGGDLGKFFSGVGSVISGGIDAAQSSAGKLAGSALGVAINPNKQIIFDGIDFRTFSFSFTFSPSSIQESNVVHDIVRTFKYHAAPTIGTGAGAAFFTPPSSFTIEYLFNGGADGGSQPNIYLNKIAECVLESITVNYAPNGIWSAFNTTGAPTQVTLTLQFKELELIDRSKINQGF